MMTAKLLVAFLGTASAFKVQTTPVDNALKLRGGYGVPLLIDGDKFFGPDGMMPYQKKDIEGPVGKFFSKFTGAMFMALSAGYLFDKDSETLAKQFGIGSALFIPLLFKNAADDVNFNSKLWMLQKFIHIPLTVITLL